MTATVKIACTICGSSILPVTAKNTGGVCRPCFYKLFGATSKLPRSPSVAYPYATIIAESLRMRGVLSSIMRVARSDLPVLIWGEAGTGKKLLAQEIHRLSKRSDNPLFAMDCSRLPDTLIGTELFGSYTELGHALDGIFQRANGGTLVIVEIGELGLAEQRRLVAAFQKGEFRRRLDEPSTKIDVRVIMTTRHSPLHMIEAGEFLRELYSFSNTVSIHVPTLRERREDIPELLDYYVPLAAGGLGLPRKKLASEVVDFLLFNPWPEMSASCKLS